MRRETKMRRERDKDERREISTSPPEFIAKHVPCQSDSHSKQGPSVRTLWHDTEMMVSPTKLIVHFALPVPISQSASTSHLKIEKFEDALHLFGKFCPQGYKKSSTRYTFTNPQHFGPQERGGKTGFQTCTTWTRTVVRPYCSWPVRS